MCFELVNGESELCEPRLKEHIYSLRFNTKSKERYHNVPAPQTRQHEAVSEQEYNEQSPSEPQAANSPIPEQKSAKFVAKPPEVHRRTTLKIQKVALSELLKPNEALHSQKKT